ncbi:hypothetical protein [Pseudalkalibacillus caeni]|uniref:Uncharacterized protein n=1 Tax=Exobacillus caeni TaxID=2574798 RepID=A0A5R9F977_9BACL|nr:hypothetical protein [Pseudalkalibacillus caeni]TLS38866.1 hypothetical protein FCL54_00695 [Pseudalkalibacillus caeni]
MTKTKKHWYGIFGSLALFAFGLYRVFVMGRELETVPYVIAFIFAITGFIGALVNGLLLFKHISREHTQ